MSTASVSIPVPSSGLGPAVDISFLVGEKTVALSGKYRGAYVLYGSHDGVRFAPLLIFNAGGVEGIKQTFSGSFAWVKLKSLATGSSGVRANVSGLSAVGDNSFASVGVGGVVDLGDDAYQVDLNFMGFGQVNGAVVVEGSLDGIGFNPIGEFASSSAGASLLGGGSGIEFSPISCPDRIRYVRLNVQGSVGVGFVVTIGGAQSESGGGGGSETLAGAYAVGVAPVDQTMVLSDARGGKIIFDASGVGFTDLVAVESLGSAGIGFEILVDGGLCIGGSNADVRIGVPGDPSVEAGAFDSVGVGAHSFAGFLGTAVGYGAETGNSDAAAVAVGYEARSAGHVAVSVGQQSVASGDSSVAVGGQSESLGSGSVAVGDGSHAYGSDDIAIGNTAQSTSTLHTNQNIVFGAHAAITGYCRGGLAAGTHASYAATPASEGGDLNPSVVVGYHASAVSVTGDGASVVLGANARSNNDWASALGSLAHADGYGSTSVGYIANAEGDYSLAEGCYSTALATGTIAIGYFASSDGDNTLCIGSHSSGGDATSFDNIAIGNQAATDNPGDAWGSSNVAIGAHSITAITSGSISIGSGAGAQGFDSTYHTDVGLIAIGSGADVISQGASIGIGNDVIVHNTSLSSTNEPSIGIGAGAQILGAGGAVVVGFGSVSYSNDSVGLGIESTNYGDYSIAIGYRSSTGNTNYAPTSVAVGANTSAFEDGDVVIGFSSHTDDGDPTHIHNIAIGPHSNAFDISCVAIGDAAIAGVGDGSASFGVAIGSSASSLGTDGVAIGHHASVVGDNGMAFGLQAVAGVQEVVFSSSQVGVKIFRAVSADAAFDDLFRFDLANLGGANTTSLTLLIMQSDAHTIVAVPVTIGANDSGGLGYAVLRVPNT